MRKRLLVMIGAVALGVTLLVGTAVGHPSRTAAAKTFTVKLSGVTFGGKANYKLTAHAGDSIKFVWAGGLHNAVASKAPSGVKKVSSGAATTSHKPEIIKLAKKGTYSWFCSVHKALGMTATVTVK